ncbi:rod shape-determining protein MreC [Corticibacter populi]|uniref:Cell shape-determining protein MreC n=1 Tax=Corticibacter populi TaxID=1550736 RepID=A0A3M6QMG8_9BURK|nr:rod shape-determining protein MreC [Corticibacter populi]RMX04135.1 rod shape-determining protein MreC [Corticibacter populi]RZS33148.1 rod shape-determining protein MreC [Corticibacter populi]
MFERRTPRIFAHGPSPASKLLVYGALALFLMVADSRFQITGPVRQVVGAAIYPLQWLMLQPVRLVRTASSYFEDVSKAREAADQAQRQLLALSEKAGQIDYLVQENQQLRALLSLRERASARSLTAEVTYEAPDPYTNRLVIDKGAAAGVRLGAPVLDSYGVLGQVTQVYPFTSEVRVVSDREQAVPVMNLRTGMRMVAFGEALARPGSGMELRYVPTGADVQVGDALVTSGIDGYYPPGIPVAEVSQVESHNDTPFLRIYAEPVAQTVSVRYVVVLEPVGLQGEHGPEPQTDAAQEPTPAPAASTAAPAARTTGRNR